MSACREFRDQLSAHLDGELDPLEAAALEAHLAQCPPCREALEGLRATVARIRALEPLEPPPWLADRILARVGRQGFWQRRIRPLAVRPQLQAAALVLVCVTGYLLTRTAAHRDLVPQPPAPVAPPTAPPPVGPELPPATGPEPSRPPEPKKAEAPRALDRRKAEQPPVQEMKAAPVEAQGFAPPPSAAPATSAAPLGAAARQDSAPAAKAKKAEARSLAEEAAPALAFHLEGAGELEVLVALRRCGATLLAPVQGRRAVARLEGRRLPELRAALARLGTLRGEVPEALPEEVEVTISW